MPETEIEYITKEWLQCELRSSASLNVKDLIILDCRSSLEYSESHIRSAVNFSIPSIMLRRLAAGKIDLINTIKSPDLKDRIRNGYKMSLFILYNDVGCRGVDEGEIATGMMTIGDVVMGGSNTSASDTTPLWLVHRRLKQDGCRVVALRDSFSSFRDAFPEWCEDDKSQNQEMESSRSTQADQLMGLRSLRISTPHSDSACSSSAESSDCESTTLPNFNEAPVEIVPGLFLGNASHSGDSRALQKYNIKYVLNVTPDLPNVFEASGGIQYLQIPITDHYSQDLAMHFPAAIQFIEEARMKNSAVLVHCLAGVSRSVTVTLAYLMHTRALCLNDAFTLVRDRKPDVSPNFHFMEQLHSFERQLRISPNESTTLMTAMEDSSSGSVTDTSTSSQSSSRCGGCGVGGGCQNHSNNKFICKCSYIAGGGGGGVVVGGKVTTTSTGISPDSGIEFDRWTPAADTASAAAAGGLK